jgi:hypothetical protein
MALSNKPFFTQGLYSAVQTLAPGDTQTIKALTTTQTNGVRITSILASSSDTAARDVCLYMTISSTNYLIAQIQVPITAGQVNTTPPVNLLKGGIAPGSFPTLPLDANGNPYIDLPSGATLSINAPVTITTAKQINVIATGEIF